jgi:hypothetical protein
LAATAALAQDRAWIGAAQKRITGGTPAVRATVDAVAQFVDVFTKIGLRKGNLALVGRAGRPHAVQQPGS